MGWFPLAAVVHALVRDQGWQVVLTGAESERLLVGEVARLAGVPVISLAGRTSVDELAGVLSIAPLLITSNTGPVHIAAATRTPVVDVYAMTNPQHQPWRVPSRVLTHPVPCAYCYKSVCPLGHHACLREISPGEVVAAATELMRETEGAVHV